MNVALPLEGGSAPLRARSILSQPDLMSGPHPKWTFRLFAFLSARNCPADLREILVISISLNSLRAAILICGLIRCTILFLTALSITVCNSFVEHGSFLNHTGREALLIPRQYR